jgi:hypothetical protein
MRGLDSIVAPGHHSERQRRREDRGPTPMSEQATPPTGPIKDAEAAHHLEGFSLDVSDDTEVDKRLADIELAGEEVAAGWKPQPHQPLSPEVRYLHVSRTIHQLIVDRNRSVGIFLFVASLLVGASTALLNAPAMVRTIVPLAHLQYWCFPITFGTLAIIGAFMSLILIRTRIGLIYEVTKMNALLGLPTTRVKRVNPLSIFFLMHAMVVLLGGASAGAVAGMLTHHAEGPAIAVGWTVGLIYALILQAAYYATILKATAETKLKGTAG